ncbi:MAG: hypothetical protein Tp1111DCM603221_31 [Prokaryotic dsDNA virus sp.]|nr:MAG: hypothetical protein Tp1111DCM603221_31 [Prokaryotic dsDNA virus sp.]|tara:strand:+ start:10577 stop:15895 length:5319 start_codon:yes stop_codon:yes gene_type:complete
MANGTSFSVTDEQIDRLSDDSKNELRKFIDLVGPDSNAIPGYYENLVSYDLRNQLTPQPEESELTQPSRGSQASADSARVRFVRERKKKYAGEGMSPSEALARARADATEFQRQSERLSIEGEPVSIAIPQEEAFRRVREGSLREAIGAVLRPQIISAGQRLTDEEKELREDVRRRFLAEPMMLADREATKKGLRGDEYSEYVDGRTQVLRNKLVSDLFVEIYRQQKQQFIESEGLNIAVNEPLPQGYETEAKFLRERASGLRDQFIQEVFPDQVEKFNIDRDTVQALRDVAEGSEDIALRGAAKAALLGRLVFRSDDEETGQVAETIPGAIFRVGTELLSPRAVTYPILKSLTWDRNPETGLPYDPEDPRYLLDQEIDEYLEKFYQNSYDASQGRDLSFPELDMGKFISLKPRGLFVSGLNIPEHMNTGSDFRDYLATVLNLDWTGTDFGRLDNASLVHPWISGSLAVVTEVASPWQMTPIGAFSKAVKEVGKGGAKLGSAISAGFEFKDSREFFRNMERFMDSEQSLAEVTQARTAYRDAMAGIGKPVSKGDIRAVEAYEDFAEKMAPSLASIIAPLDEGVNPLTKAAFKGLDPDTPYANSIRMISQKYDQIRSALRKDNWAEVLRKTPTGRELLVHIQEAARSAPNASKKVWGQKALINIAKTEMMGVLQDALPTGWVRVGNTVVRRNVFKANQKEILSKMRNISQAHRPRLIKGKYHYKYKDHKKAYAAAVVGAGETAFTKNRRPLFEKLLTNKPLTSGEYHMVQTYIEHAVIESVLGKVGRSVVPKSQVTEKVYKKAGVAAIDRNIGIVDGTKDFFRGAYSIVWNNPIVESHYPKAKGMKLIPFDLKTFNTKIDPELYQEFTVLTNRLNELPLQLTKILRSGDVEAGDALLQSAVKGENPTAVYEEMIELFFDPTKKEVGNMFGKAPDGSSVLTNVVAEAVKSKRLPWPPTIDGMKAAVDLAYDKANAKMLVELQERGLKARGVRITGSNPDNIRLLWSAYILGKKGQPLYDEAFENLNKVKEGVFIQLPAKGKDGFAYRATVLRPILLENGIDPAVTQKIIETFVRDVRSTASAATQRTIARDVMEYIFNNGFLPSKGEFGQMYHGVTKGVSNTEAAGRGLGSRWGELDKILKEAYGDNPVKLTEVRNVVSEAWVKALTDIDYDRIYSLFNQQGIITRTGEGIVADGSRTLPEFMNMRGTNLTVLEGRNFKVGAREEPVSDMAKVISEYSDFNKWAKVNKRISNMRPADRKIFTWVLEGAQWSRKMTIGGLLHGWGKFPGLRYMSNNGITAPLITAVSAPAQMVTVLANMPAAFTAGVMRGIRESGFIRTSDAFDYRTLELKGPKTPGGFVDAKGTWWTNEAIEQAAQRQNIRFSRTTFDYQYDAISDLGRALRRGPGGKPVWEMPVFNTKFTRGYRGPRGPAEFMGAFRPDRKNVYSSIAESMDNMQREAIFRNGLKLGMGEQNAGALARAGFLDYGALPERVKKAASRWFAFFAFRYRMTADFFQALLRGGEGARNIGRVAGLIRSQYEDMQEWVLTPDWLKSRLWINHGDNIKQYLINQYGPGVPWAEGVHLMGQVVDFFLAEERTKLTGQVLVNLVDQLDPRYGAALATYREASKLQGTNFAPSGYVPATFLESANLFGIAPWFIDLMEMEKVDKDKQRPDLPTFNGEQYKFGPNGKAMFEAINLLRLSLALKRGPDDTARLAAKLGIDLPYGVEVEFNKDGMGNPFMFILGETTASILENPEFIRQRQNEFLYTAYSTSSR